MDGSKVACSACQVQPGDIYSVLTLSGLLNGIAHAGLQEVKTIAASAGDFLPTLSPDYAGWSDSPDEPLVAVHIIKGTSFVVSSV